MSDIINANKTARRFYNRRCILQQANNFIVLFQLTRQEKHEKNIINLTTSVAFASFHFLLFNCILNTFNGVLSLNQVFI